MSASPLLLLLAVGAPMQDAPPREDADASHWHFEFAPPDLLYRGYVADPRRPTFGVTGIDASESEIPGAGDRRYGIRMGGEFPILQLRPSGAEGGGVQLAGGIGFLAQFDRENSLDNLGWDGLYGFHIAWEPSRDLVLRLGMAHDSSHIGDEYIESTGATRIDYTRQEFMAGMRYAPWTSVGAYAEYGHGYDLRNEDLQEEGRVQCGLELEPEPTWWNDQLAPFAALDVSAYQEDDWDENLTVQLGVVRPGKGRAATWRVGLEYYDGRAPIAEFFQERERYLAWGLWIDL